MAFGKWRRIDEAFNRRLVDLNTASEEDLAALPCLGKELAHKLVLLRKKKQFHCLCDLQKIHGVSAETLEHIGRYGYVHPELGIMGSAGEEDRDAELRRSCGVLMMGHWNVRNLGRAALETDRAKDVAAIIAEYDVVALLELRDKEIVDGLVNMLGSEAWGAAVSREVGDENRKEVYAYLYRKAAVELQCEEVVRDTSDKWVREPYLASFRAPGGFDFVLAAIHATWGKSVGERRLEIEALGSLLKRIEKWDGGEKDLLLLGDFNLEPTDKAWAKTRAAGWVPLLEDHGEGLKSMVGDTHLYDNIWAHSKHTVESEWLGASGVIRFDKVLKFGKKSESDKRAIKEFSDHRPTWALFAARADDDEGDAAETPLFHKAKPKCGGS